MKPNTFRKMLRRARGFGLYSDLLISAAGNTDLEKVVAEESSKEELEDAERQRRVRLLQLGKRE